MAKTAVNISPLMVVAGPEVFLRVEHLRNIQSAVLGEEDPGMARVRLDSSSSMANVLDEVRTPSMFCPKKLVIVDPADGLLKAGEEEDAPKGKRPVLSNRELLENYVDSPADSGVLVLVCDKWLKTTRIHKALAARGAVFAADAIKAFQATAWIAKRSRDAYGKTIDPEACARLADLIGPDLQRLDNELAKLSLYEPKSPAITPATVDALVGFQHEQQIWELITALAARDAATALKKIDELWQMDPKLEYSAVGAIASWLTTVLRAREMIDKRMPDGVIMRDLKLFPEDRARKVLALARQWGLPGSARWSETLLRVDVANKTGLGEPRRNLERFIVALAS